MPSLTDWAQRFIRADRPLIQVRLRFAAMAAHHQESCHTYEHCTCCGHSFVRRSRAKWSIRSEHQHLADDAPSQAREIHAKFSYHLYLLPTRPRRVCDTDFGRLIA